MAACRKALTEYARERDPLDWAATQDSLGYALTTLGERTADAGQVEQAMQSLTLALSVFRSARDPTMTLAESHLKRAQAALARLRAKHATPAS